MVTATEARRFAYEANTSSLPLKYKEEIYNIIKTAAQKGAYEVVYEIGDGFVPEIVQLLKSQGFIVMVTYSIVPKIRISW